MPVSDILASLIAMAMLIYQLRSFKTKMAG